jgi:serine/threonine protein kinase
MGRTHRDLKLENLLLDQNYNLIVADFGLTSLLQGNYGTGTLLTLCGTEMYKAPEINSRKEYMGAQVDLYAATICMFALKSGSFPFGKATQDDALFQFLACNRADKLWTYHERERPVNFFSQDFKNLFTTMLSPEPS